MLLLRAASVAARLGFFEGAPALRARDSLGHALRARVRCWHLLFLSRLGAAGSVGEQVLRGAVTAPPQVFALPPFPPLCYVSCSGGLSECKLTKGIFCF